MPALRAVSTNVASVATADRWKAVVPCSITAAGVSGDMPAPSRRSTTDARALMPM